MLSSSLTSDQLRGSLRDMPLVDLTLHDSLLDEEQLPAKLVWALAGSAPTLTALHGLPLGQLAISQPEGLAPFARLRDLTLWQLPGQPEVVCATLLPLSLVELRLEAGGSEQVPPLLSNFGRLQQLRRITFAKYFVWHFLTGDDERQRFR